MLRVFRSGYDTPGIDIGIFEFSPSPDGSLWPRLVHIEHREDAQAALRELGPTTADTATISICPCVTEIRTGPETAHASSRSSKDFSDVVAEYYFGNTLVINKISSTTLAGTVGQSTLAEPTCLVSAFATAYHNELSQYGQVGHLHLSERQIDLFVYNRGELIFHGTELPENDRLSFEDTANVLLSDPNMEWRSYLELIVVSGGNQWLRANQIDWLDPNIRKEALAWTFEADRLFSVELRDADAQRMAARPDHRFFKTSVPVLLAGAARSFADQHAADFRKQISSLPPEKQAAGWGNRLRGLFSGNGQSSSHPLMKNLGLVLTGVFLILFGGGQWAFLTRQEARLAADLAVEKKREEGNRVLEQEAKNYKAVITAINRRVELVNKLRESQRGDYEITNNVYIQTPQTLKLTSLRIQGRDVTIQGYVTVSTAAEPATPPAPGQPPPPPPNPKIDVADPVTEFIKNLQQSNKYNNIQSKYNQTGGSSTFTITCSYTGSIVTESIETQPIPTIINQAGGTAK
ncbi:MAG: hypothetical protein K1Y36_23695 [Blastocatellia bacterium]|nr:hypothetical protein [Blastocatellia bacterium]